MANILIVCSANMCRSPMAELLLHRQLEQSARSGWKVHSAGANAGVGWPAAQGAIEATQEIGLDFAAHRSRAVIQALLAEADLVLLMEQANRAELVRLFGRLPDKVRPFTSMVGSEVDVQDPIGGPPEAYRQCAVELRSMIEEGLPWLMRSV